MILSPEVIETMRSLRHFVVESERTAGRLLSRILSPEALQASSFRVLDEHTLARDVPLLLAPALAGQDLGLISEAGCPCVADPGSDLAAAAHRHEVPVLPLPGPSSILQALMASGFSGQSFLFLGYIPARSEDRRAALQRIERECRRDRITRIFIEAPYRNRAVLEDALRILAPDTRLCVAASLGGPSTRVRSAVVEEWRTMEFKLEKEPAVFLLAHGTPAADVPGLVQHRPEGSGSPQTGRGRTQRTGRKSSGPRRTRRSPGA